MKITIASAFVIATLALAPTAGATLPHSSGYDHSGSYPAESTYPKESSGYDHAGTYPVESTWGSK